MSDLCLRCSTPVRARQQGLCCEVCDRWYHRTCGTGISQDDYRRAVQEETEIEWQCPQ
ncbi:hypothetical protein QZH41_001145 [Actinostola sp. cb2023]|nr:hypothetical protein QZH41_001145 [Actinostola sp. cb2023]